MFGDEFERPIEIGDIYVVNVDVGWVDDPYRFFIVRDVDGDNIAVQELAATTEQTSRGWGGYKTYEDMPENYEVDGAPYCDVVFTPNDKWHQLTGDFKNAKGKSYEVRTVRKWDEKPVTWDVDTTG